MKGLKLNTMLIAFTSIAVLTLAGCGRPSEDPGATRGDAEPGQSQDQAAGESHDHSGWWCVEHGIPEEVCSMCSTSAAAKFKEQGDWCEEHNRAESQCFLCDSSRAERFAKLYEAKFGHQPPEPLE